MNIWDSVHRGLEKASHEAARIAKTQRLRSISDKVSRQINEQEGALLHKVMQLFASGMLTQNELVPLAQELAYLHQQLAQAHNELQLLNSQGANPPVAQLPPPAAQNMPPDTYAGQTPAEGVPTIYASPPYSAFVDGTLPASPPPPPGVQMSSTDPRVYAPTEQNNPGTPPPPPGMQTLTVSQQETILDADNQLTPPPPPGMRPVSASSGGYVAAQAAPEDRRLCLHCNTPAQLAQQFCQNCGASLSQGAADHLPTMRANNSAFQHDIETVRVPESANLENHETILASLPITPAPEETVLPPDAAPQSASIPSTEKDGGQ